MILNWWTSTAPIIRTLAAAQYADVSDSIRKEAPSRNIENDHMFFVFSRARYTLFCVCHGYGPRRRETATTADWSRSDTHTHTIGTRSNAVKKFTFNQFLVHAVDIGDTASVDKATTVGSVNTTVKQETRKTSVDVTDDRDDANCDSFFPCDPRRWMHRYLMLGFMCMLSFGSYYVYDNPTALQSTIIKVSSREGGGV